ncbi:hypothetical protein QFC22_004310 [Naganishia vaughanmartiniae]|uniref:Uncharacterized protein n=1 Tax=Naganishia vaughanmartiniae TaxID=1424756 RepID=A0ACC2X094_9TREE|nr:hypothetical protein QFC22_004310 [Naganishia vaughanmartiniae]
MTAPVSSFADKQSAQPNGTTTPSVKGSTSAPPAASNGLASITQSAAKTTALGKANIKQSSKLVAGNADKLDVWSIFTPANMPADAINLGQGFMNWKPPQWVRDASQKAMDEDVMSNHYSHPRGRPRLLNAISKHYSPQFENLVQEGRQLKPEEIVVTAGANEGMFAALLAFLEQGDEVICIEPFFDQYLASIIFNGGKPVYVPLHPPQTTEGKTHGSDWKLDLVEFEKAFTEKTKVVIINTPHNPSGKCFTREELHGLAEICTRHNVLVLADEVYDCLTYDGNEHVRIAALPGMWDRTLTVGSAGKSFAATGWRVGWLIGPPELTLATLQASTRIIFCTNSPLQEAVAAGLERAEEHNFFPDQIQAYTERRDTLTKYFDELGLSYTVPEGSYFVLVNIEKIKTPKDYDFPAVVKGRGADFEKCWFMAQELKVVAIPPSEVGDIAGFLNKAGCTLTSSIVPYSSTVKSTFTLARGSRDSPS